MQFKARQAEIYAHLFENPHTGLARNLFWNISVELDPCEIGGEEWNSSFQCEWLTWPLKTIRDLDGIRLAQVCDPEMVEASIYLIAEHHSVTVSDLVIRRAGGGYDLTASGVFDIEADGRRLRGPFHIHCGLRFEGILVVPDNLFPKPSSPAEATAAVAPFISLTGFDEPRFDEFRYVISPTAL